MLEGGTFTDKTGQRSSARIHQKVVDVQIHLQYCGNPYALSKQGTLYYNVGQEAMETGGTHIDGAVYISSEQMNVETFCMKQNQGEPKSGSCATRGAGSMQDKQRRKKFMQQKWDTNKMLVLQGKPSSSRMPQTYRGQEGRGGAQKTCQVQDGQEGERAW